MGKVDNSFGKKKNKMLWKKSKTDYKTLLYYICQISKGRFHLCSDTSEFATGSVHYQKTK